MSITVLGKHKTTSSDASESNGKVTKTYTETYRVLTTDPLVNSVDIGLAFVDHTGIQRGTLFPGDSTCYCKGIGTERESDDGTVWIVTVKYGTADSNSSGGGGDQSLAPWRRKAKVKWSHVNVPQNVLWTIDGKMIANSCGDPFAEPVTRDSAHAVLTVTQNELMYDEPTALGYINTVNANTWLGGKAGTLKCLTFEGEKQEDENWGQYWTVNFSAEYNPDPGGWDTVILDAGYRQLVKGAKYNIMVNGVPVNSPVPLNGKGQPISTGGQPYWLSFRLYNRRNWSFNVRV